MSWVKDIKAYLQSVFAIASTSVTAGGTGDATEVNGATIDISALTKRPTSVVFEIPVRAVLAATKTITITANIQESIDGSTWTDVEEPAVILTLTGGAGGSTETGVARIGMNLHRADCNYIRVQATPDMSNAATDTAVMGAGVACFGGHDNDAA